MRPMIQGLEIWNKYLSLSGLLALKMIPRNISREWRSEKSRKTIQSALLSKLLLWATGINLSEEV